MAIATPSKIEMWPVARLVPYEHNARTHPPEQVEKVAASIVSYGFNAPILVDSKDGIIAGHCRLMAAKQLNLKEVPVIKLDHLTEKKKRAYILADNKLSELGGWDENALNYELEMLKDWQIDMTELGFDDSQLDVVMEELDEHFEDQDEIEKDTGLSLCVCPKCGHEFESS